MKASWWVPWWYGNVDRNEWHEKGQRRRRSIVTAWLNTFKKLDRLLVWIAEIGFYQVLEWLQSDDYNFALEEAITECILNRVLQYIGCNKLTTYKWHDNFEVDVKYNMLIRMNATSWQFACKIENRWFGDLNCRMDLPRSLEYNHSTVQKRTRVEWIHNAK